MNLIPMIKLDNLSREQLEQLDKAVKNTIDLLSRMKKELEKSRKNVRSIARNQFLEYIYPSMIEFWRTQLIIMINDIFSQAINIVENKRVGDLKDLLIITHELRIVIDQKLIDMVNEVYKHINIMNRVNENELKQMLIEFYEETLQELRGLQQEINKRIEKHLDYKI